MTDDERRAALWAGALLLLASLVRLGWEVRPVPPLLPADTTAYAELIDETRAAVDDEERRRTPLGPGERIDPNRGSEVEIARLPGIGPALAGRIVEARAEAPFQRPEDLLEVPGVGPSTLEAIRPLLDFDDPPPPVRSAGFRGDPDRIDVNRASAAELEDLPGIGPALAARIVEDRGREGPFRMPEDLLRVSGIGPSTLERLRDHLDFGW